MRSALLLILLVYTAGLSGCSDDDPAAVVVRLCDPCFKPLDKRDNLLHNLDLAYNQRNFEEFRKLLDTTPAVFVFHFGQSDIDRGIAAVPKWNVSVEAGVTQWLFDMNPPPGQPVANDIVLEMTYAEGEDEWDPFVPATHPQETWYRRVVSYRLAVRIGLSTHTQNKDTFTEFTARYTQAAGDSVWQIVTWRDDVPAPPPGGKRHTRDRAPSDTGETTWGGIKELFRKGVSGR